MTRYTLRIGGKPEPIVQFDHEDGVPEGCEGDYSDIEQAERELEKLTKAIATGSR
jgi:hypothetical protein